MRFKIIFSAELRIFKSKITVSNQALIYVVFFVLFLIVKYNLCDMEFHFEVECLCGIGLYSVEYLVRVINTFPHTNNERKFTISR